MSDSRKRKLILLAGNPNAGKSTLFNLLTGLNQHVGNYPGVTVDKKSGVFLVDTGVHADILDLPGAYSLYPTAKDERVVVHQFLSEPRLPDVVVYVADVSQLEKQTLLLTQIRDLGIPVILALNMVDMDGITVKTEQLAAHFGIPVLPISGKTGFGIDQLKQEIKQQLHTPIVPEGLYYTPSADERQIISELEPHLAQGTAYHHLLTIHHAEWLTHLDSGTRQLVAKKRQDLHFHSLQHQINETLSRYDRFTPTIRQSLFLEEGGAGIKITDRIDRWVMHPFLGSIIFFFIMLLVFQAIFAWATYPMDWIESAMGSLSGGIRDVLPAGWVVDLLCDGLIAGLTGILVFIPQIAILFFFIGILEEVGYMSRVVSMFDVMLRRFGLNGRSIVALVSGGACAIPAIMSTRNISNWKERLITILVTPFISCSARIPVYAILIGFAVPAGTIWGFQQQGLALMLLYGIGIVAALTASLVLKQIIKSNDRSFLMIELPVYRAPVSKNLFILVFEKTKAFVIGAGKIIIVISVILWFLASFGPGISGEKGDRKFSLSKVVPGPALEDSYAGLIGKGIEPGIAPLGFDWKIGIALITSFAAREVFVGTMATIYSIEDDADVTSIRTQMAGDRHPDTGALIYNPATAWSLLIFYVFAMQCMSTLAIVKRETHTWKWPLIQFVMMTALAYFSSLLVYQLLR